MQEPESKKTLVFVLVAGMALLVAWEPWRPAPPDTSVPERVGQQMFPDFDNPLAAKSLEIVTFDEKTSDIDDFKVAQINGVWSIPSHNNYPADAQDHMAKAATALMDLKILSVISNKPGDQKTFGVVTPDPTKLKVGETGVGTRVIARNAKDKPLADLVIGKQDKDQPGVHYVREAGRDLIYRVRINTADFSTKFGDWIEKDLLKLTALDIRDVDLNDYSSRAVVGPDGRGVLQLDQRSKIDLAYDDATAKWKLVSMEEFEQGQPHPVELAADEELNDTKLNALKTALDDLQIVDVQRKPEGLSEDLRASDEFLNNVEAVQSLHDRGFVAVPRGPGMPPEIFSSEGEVAVTTKDGVRYVLRFGDIAGVSMAGDETSGDAESTDEGGDDSKSSGPSRYLFVMAQFDEDQIPKPDLQPIPGEAAESKPEASPDEQPQDEAAPPADADKPAENKPAEAAEEKPAADTPAEGDAAEPEASVPETKTAAQEPGEEASETDAPKTEEAEASESDSGEKEAEAPLEEPAAEEPAAQPSAAPQPTEEEKLRVRQENKRKQDEYDEAVKRGQEKAKELNDRFADWYFIISDDVYQKIHLGRNDIIEKKGSGQEGGLGELKGLEDSINIGPALKQQLSK